MFKNKIKQTLFISILSVGLLLTNIVAVNASEVDITITDTPVETETIEDNSEIETTEPTKPEETTEKETEKTTEKTNSNAKDGKGTLTITIDWPESIPKYNCVAELSNSETGKIDVIYIMANTGYTYTGSVDYGKYVLASVMVVDDYSEEFGMTAGQAFIINDGNTSENITIRFTDESVYGVDEENNDKVKEENNYVEKEPEKESKSSPFSILKNNFVNLLLVAFAGVGYFVYKKKTDVDQEK